MDEIRGDWTGRGVSGRVSQVHPHDGQQEGATPTLTQNERTNAYRPPRGFRHSSAGFRFPGPAWERPPTAFWIWICGCLLLRYAGSSSVRPSSRGRHPVGELVQQPPKFPTRRPTNSQSVVVFFDPPAARCYGYAIVNRLRRALNNE